MELKIVLERIMNKVKSIYIFSSRFVVILMCTAITHNISFAGDNHNPSQNRTNFDPKVDPIVNEVDCDWYRRVVEKANKARNDCYGSEGYKNCHSGGPIAETQTCKEIKESCANAAQQAEEINERYIIACA